jgi:hypothetical protein
MSHKPYPLRIDTVNLQTEEVETRFTDYNCQKCRLWLARHTTWALRSYMRIELTPVHEFPADWVNPREHRYE